jgi:hypothetical protein
MKKLKCNDCGLEFNKTRRNRTLNVSPDYVYIVDYRKNNIEGDLIKQLNFKQDLEGAKRFVHNNRKSEKEKGILISVFHGYINEEFPCEIVEDKEE